MRRTLAAVALVAVVAGCGPKVAVTPGFDPSAQRLAALLPVERSDDVARERAERVRAAVEAELKNNGYVLLDDAAVASACASTNANCKSSGDRTALFDRYDVTGVFQLTVSSASRNNFVAGYYNTLSGVLTFQNRAGETLLTVDHTEREKGGLLFNTGQLLEGLKSQISNSGDESFDALAARFARSVTDEIPNAPRGENAPAAAAAGKAVNVEALKITAYKVPAYQVCVTSQPKLMAFLVSGRGHSNLREVAPGNYCGIYRFDDVLASAGKNPLVEVRSPFGETASRELEQPPGAACALTGLHKELLGNGHVRLSLACEGGASSGCVPQSCANDKLMVYSADSIAGPFLKVGELRQYRWEDNKTGGGKEYQVVAVDRSGNFSVPVSPKEGA
jgi:hypothetical protein